MKDKNKYMMPNALESFEIEAKNSRNGYSPNDSLEVSIDAHTIGKSNINEKNFSNGTKPEYNKEKTKNKGVGEIDFCVTDEGKNTIKHILSRNERLSLIAERSSMAAEEKMQLFFGDKFWGLDITAEKEMQNLQANHSIPQVVSIRQNLEKVVNDVKTKSDLHAIWASKARAKKVADEARKKQKGIFIHTAMNLIKLYSFNLSK